jgi:outer membrane protein assembly factor BamA
MKLLPALLLLFAAQAASAQTAPIAAVRLEGNRVTRDKVILREMDLRAGDAADPAAIERNRQAILDLGLFREVEVVTEPAAGGVVLVVRMREKRFLLPIPRVDTSSDEDFSYGAQLRWSNVFGLNHTLNAYYERGDFPNERDRASESTARVSYSAPRVRDSRYDVRGRLEHEEQRTRADTGDYDETFDRVEMLVARDFTTARPRRGWIVGGGL